MQAGGIVTGVCVTAWSFLYLLGRSLEYGAGLEAATALIPLAALGLFLYLVKRKASAAARWFALEFFAASLPTYLIMQLVVARLL